MMISVAAIACLTGACSARIAAVVSRPNSQSVTPSGLPAVDAQHPDPAGSGSPGIPTGDTSAPVPTVGVAASDVTDSALTLTWAAASDDVSDTASLVYCVYQSTALVYQAGVDPSSANSSLVGACQTDLTTLTVSALNPSTHYEFGVFVKDEAGNVAFVGGIGTDTLVDQTPPIPGAQGGIVVTEIGKTSARVSWTRATDFDPQPSLSYFVASSATDDLRTVAGMLEPNIGQGAGYVMNDTDSMIVSRLEPGRTYFVNVLVWDTHVNRAVYNSATFTTPEFSGGSGTVGDPWQISSVEELQRMRHHLSAHFILTQNIDASVTYSWNAGGGFLPVGTIADPFTGSLRGNGKIISRLLVGQPGSDGVGLFGALGVSGASTGTVSRLGLHQVVVYGRDQTGGVAGVSAGVISEVFVRGAVQGGNQLGALVGQQTAGTIQDSYAMARVYSKSNDLGGLVGAVSSGASLARVYMKGMVYVEAVRSGVGGLVGTNGGAISDAFAFNSVAATGGTTSKGALVGRNLASGTLSGVYQFDHVAVPATCIGTDDSGSATCTSNKTTEWYKTPVNAPLSTWDFSATGKWIMPQDEGYAVLAWEAPNAPATFAPHYKNGRKIGSSDKSAYPLAGYCSVPGSAINLSYTDSGSGTASNTTTCVGGRWNTTTNLTALAQGTVMATVTQTVGGGSPSAAATLSLNMDTTFCDGNPSVGSYAGGDGSVGTPYQLCTLAHFDAISSNVTKQFRLMNNLDLSPAWSSNGSLTGVFDGNGFTMRGAPRRLFGTLQGGGIVRNFSLEEFEIVCGAVSNCGAIAAFGFTGGSSVQNVTLHGLVRGIGAFGGHAAIWGSSGTGPSSIVNVDSWATVIDGSGPSAIVGSVDTMSGVHVYGDLVSGDATMGGAVLILNSSMTDTHVHGTSMGGWWAGGLIANANAGASITNSSTSGWVLCSRTACGGFMGRAAPGAVSISNSTSSAFVAGAYQIGGIVGHSWGTISGVTFSGVVVGGGEYSPAGGIGAHVSGNTNILNSEVTGVVSGRSGYQTGVGGFLGTNSLSGAVTSIEDSRFSGRVAAPLNATDPNGSATGAIIGRLVAPSSSTTLARLTVEGSVASAARAVGGIVGYIGDGANMTTGIQDVRVSTNVTSSGTGVGGALGKIATTSGTASFQRVLVTGSIAGSSNCGGLVGWAFDGTTLNLADSVAAPLSFSCTNTLAGGIVGQGISTPIDLGSTSMLSQPKGPATCFSIDPSAASVACGTQTDHRRYFDPAVPPLTVWDFTNVWRVPDPVGFPDLR